MASVVQRGPNNFHLNFQPIRCVEIIQCDTHIMATKQTSQPDTAAENIKKLSPIIGNCMICRTIMALEITRVNSRQIIDGGDSY